MNYKNLQTNADEPETLSGDDAKIRELLGDLRRADAPNDFDFRVRARIAQSSSADFRPRFSPVLRYVLPLAVVSLMSAGLVFNSFYNGDSANNSVVATANLSPKPIGENQSIQTNAPENNPAYSATSASEKTDAPPAPAIAVKNKTAPPSDVARQTAVEKSAAKVKSKFSPENASSDGGGVRSSALTPPKRVITPPGISLDKTVGDENDFVKTKSLTAREILRQIGIEAGYENETWKVLSVEENSPAKRSDVKIGDAVEAIDGEKLTDKPLPTKTIEGKKITVRRGAQRIEIPLGLKAN